MQRVSAKLRLIPVSSALVAALLWSGVGVAQSVADNIRPVGQVCLAGQPCVGTTRGGAASAPVAAAPVAAPAVAPAPAPAAAAPAAAEPAVAAFDPAATYQMSCFACHGTGAAGAPKLGDTEDWNARMEKGMDAVMANVFNGITAMPARGLCMTCTDENLRALVDYMIAQ